MNDHQILRIKKKKSKKNGNIELMNGDFKRANVWE